MRRMLLAVVLCLSAVPHAAAGEGDAAEPLPTRWMAPPGVERLPHDVWRASGPFTVWEVAATEVETRAETGRVAIIVEDAIYADIESALAQYQSDLADKGYSSVLSLVSGGTPEDLRTYLVGLFNSPAGLVGTVLVGDVPYTIYEMMQDWDGSGGDPPQYEDFPFDLFFMDLDGTWLDNGAGGTVPAGNGKYDVWDDPNHDLEIWCGRMKVDTLSQLGQPEDILNNYFLKNHLYRTGKLVPETPPATGLVYVDDDWGDMVLGTGGDQWCVAQVYGSGNVTSIYDVGSNPGNNATGGDYTANRMTDDYQLVMLRSHGYPAGHGFYRDYRSTFDYVFFTDYMSIDPEGLFYSLFVCSGSDYTAEYGTYSGYLAGTIAFNDDYGLVAWGSAKTGGIWNDQVFYSTLGEPNAFGPAFVDWFNVSHVLYADYAPRWWYGMVLTGDPTLIPNGDYFAPEEPTGLIATSGLGRIDVGWQPNPAPDLDYYNLYRGTDRATPQFLVAVSAPDTTYPDFAVGHDTTYTYWVTAVDNLNNESGYSQPDTCTYVDLTRVVSADAAPLARALTNRPNPFNPSTEITFSLDRPSDVRLRVYDVSGRCVRTLVDGTISGGIHTAVWDGRDERGAPAGSGVYLCRLEQDGAPAAMRKMMLLK